MAANRKPASARQDKRTKRADLEVVPSGPGGGVERLVPKPKPKWLRQTVEAWEAFWTSDQARVVQPQHRPMAWRLFGMVDDQERAFRAYRKRPSVPGSQGQPATNPAFAEAMALERSIVALEDRIGLNPKAMANLGIGVGARRSRRFRSRSRSAHDSVDSR